MQEQNKQLKECSYAQAIHDALEVMMKKDSAVVLIGEGVPDPKAIFETTRGLKEQFGEDRVFDMPLAENAMTGICIGAALTGLRPVLVHQRLDFSLLTLDQLVNNAAKWHIMFGGQHKVPLVIRMIIGRGWGQGPQHSQSLQALFAHIPGLKVVMPTSPKDAKGMLIKAIKDDNPVIFIEHKWLHVTSAKVPVGYYETSLEKAALLVEGKHITIAAISYMVLEALAVRQAFKKIDIEVEVIDLRNINPMDYESVILSVKKTGLLIAADTGHLSFGVTAELCTRVFEGCFNELKKPPKRISLPDFAVSTSHYASDEYYPRATEIVEASIELLDISDEQLATIVMDELTCDRLKDVPRYERVLSY